MARSQKRLPASVNISKTAIENATATLQDLPEKPKENWSLREAVSLLQETISTALSKGYSYEEISKMLTSQGIEISASSLKSYLSAAKRQKGAATRRRKPGRKPQTSMATASLNGSNGTTNSLNGLAAEPQVAVPAEKPTRRRTRIGTGSKTAAKTKTTGRTSTKTTKPDKSASRGRRKGSAMS
jgi:hypothetical protein